MRYRTKDIAKKCNVSIATIRNYEAAGFMPQSERAENNYRIFTSRHVAYMQCALSMRAGFSRLEIITILQAVQNKDARNALLHCSRKQRNLLDALESAESIVALLDAANLTAHDIPSKLSIQETSKYTKVPVTTLRHWENEGLLTPLRTKGNNYRVYDTQLISRILIIRTIRSAIWSLDEVRKTLQEFDGKNPATVHRIAQESLYYLYQLNIHQHQGIASLYELLKIEALVEPHYEHDYTFNFNIQ